MAGNENRKPNGQFAPKGTGDQTGARKSIATKAGEDDGSVDELHKRLGRASTNEEYKEFIYPKMRRFYDEYKSEGYSDEDIKKEMKDAFYYPDLIERVFKEKETKVGENDSIRKEFEESKKSPSESVREEYQDFLASAKER